MDVTRMEDRLSRRFTVTITATVETDGTELDALDVRFDLADTARDIGGYIVDEHTEIEVEDD